MIWIGRSRIVDHRRQSRSRSVRIRSARLYVANRRAKPMVSMFGIEHVAGGFDRLVALAAAAALPADAAADEGQQQVLQRVVRFPQLARIDVVDLLPDFGLAHPRASS